MDTYYNNMIELYILGALLAIAFALVAILMVKTNKKK